MAKAQEIKVEVEEIEVDEDEESVMTPKALATELEVSPKTLRSFLRREFPRSAQEKNTSWKLTEDQVAKAREHFSVEDDDEEEGDEDE